MVSIDSVNKYIIDFNTLLGQGSSASTFLGLRKEDGSQCAFKCSKTAQRKDLGILKDLNHENIVKLLDSFNKYNGYDDVIVIEYCNRCSLKDFYELHNGLCDNMFLLVLQCLSKGICYLKDKNIALVDINTSNIMIHEDSMGYFQMKISNLGSSKRDDDEASVNIKNSEMFVRSLKNVIKKRHNAVVDLWSLGVLLYQCATTEQPFIPFNYPPDSVDSIIGTFLNMTPGHISGRQNSVDVKDVTWGKHLHGNCRLSESLCDLASVLIGRLLQLNDTNTYESFFEKAERIISNKRLLMFTSWNGQLQLHYFKSLTFRNVSAKILKLTNSFNSDVKIFTKQGLLESLSTSLDFCFKSIPIKGHFKYQLTNETILLISSNHDKKMCNLSSRYIERDSDYPRNRFNTLKDSKKYSSQLMKAIYGINMNANYIDCQIECYIAVAGSFNGYVLKSMKLINTSSIWKIKSMQTQCRMLSDILKVAKMLIRAPGGSNVDQDSIDTCETALDQMEIKIKEGEKCMEEYYTKLVVKRLFASVTDRVYNKDIVSDPLDCLVHLAEGVMNEIKMMRDESIITSDDNYKLAIWQRQ